MQLKTFLGNIARGCGLILYPRGRDNRAQFWPFASLCFGVMFCIPSDAALDLYRDWASADRGEFVGRVAASDEQHLMLNYFEMQAMFAVIKFAFVAVLFSAMVRRLHDGGMSGAQAFASLISAFTLMWLLMASNIDMSLSGQIISIIQDNMIWVGLVGMLWIGHFIYLVILLARPSDRYFNKWGAESASKRDLQITALGSRTMTSDTRADATADRSVQSARRAAILRGEDTP